jgi:hypothetical protein
MAGASQNVVGSISIPAVARFSDLFARLDPGVVPGQVGQCPCDSKHIKMAELTTDRLGRVLGGGSLASAK